MNNRDIASRSYTSRHPAERWDTAFQHLGRLHDLSIAEAALAYAAAGWPVFPCNPQPDNLDAKRRRAKMPLVPGADKDGRGAQIPQTGGLWRATTNEAQIRQWWAKHPRALIGVPTGERIGLFVLDLDPRGEPVEDVLKRLRDAVGELPPGPVTVTPSGGLHLWFRNPVGEALPRNSAKCLQGVDWRGQGGYVIVAPSLMLNGRGYEWAPGPFDLEFPSPPSRLLDLMSCRGTFAVPEHQAKSARGTIKIPITPNDPGEQAVRRYALGALDRARSELACCAVGQRGHTVNALAYSMGRFVGANALTEREVFAALKDGADACGLTQTDGAAERDAKIHRGLHAGMRNVGELGHTLERIRQEAGPHSRRREGKRRRAAAQLLSPVAEMPASASPTLPEAPELPADPGGANPVTPLGHHGGIYFYLSKAGEVRRLKDQDHKRLPLISLFDGDDSWLIKQCPAYDRRGTIRPGEWDQDTAARVLIQHCAAQGLFDPNTQSRGPGVWRTSAGRLVVHVGNAICILTAGDCLALADGAATLNWQRAGQMIDGSLYTASARCMRPAPQPAPRSAGEALLAGLRLWTYAYALSADIILGFLGAAFLGGAPSWRVHLLLSAQGGSGKTWLMSFLDAALGGMAAYANDVTEAGLRQALTGESRVLLLDEAEGDEGSSGKVEGVIRLLRLMSSGEGANVMRGSAGGRAQSFQVTGCAVMAAILPAPLKPQDRSRICVIDMVRPPSGRQAARAAEQVTMAINTIRSLAPGLRMRAIAGWPRFLDTFALYRAGLISIGLSGRNADTLATIMAGRDLLLQDSVPDADSVEQDLELFAPFMAKAEETEEEGEGQQCLTHLCSSPFDRWRDGERSTVAELIMERRNDLLARVGLKLQPIEDGGALLVANQHVGLDRIFLGSKWSNGRWVTALRYLDGCEPLNKTTRFAGLAVRATIVPAKYLPRSD